MKWILLLMLSTACASYKGDIKMPKRKLLRYHTHERNIGELTLPTQHNSKLVVLVHGGAWQKRDFKDMRMIAKSLSSHGYIVFNINYRLAPEFNHPAPIDDLGLAINFIHKHLREQNINVDKTALWGYSAGGHITSYFALKYPEKKIDAVVAGGTPFDFSLGTKSNYIEKYLGGSFQEIPQSFKEASPITHLDKDAPNFYIYHCKKDKVVTPRHKSHFIKKLKELELDYEDYDIKFWGHISAFIFSKEAVKRGVLFLNKKL